MLRRSFIRTTGLAGTGVLLSVNALTSGIPAPKIKAIAFDAFPIFDPRPIFKRVKQLFPEKGELLNALWKTKQFDYQWLRLLGNRYRNFWEVTQEALDYAANECGIVLTEDEIGLIMNEYKAINFWPDVAPALQQLKNDNLKLCFLSNMTAEMLNRGLQNSNAEEYFDHVISTDQKKTYKPSPDAYQMGVDILNLKKEEILFVAFAGWDVAGAKWFGYPTYWVNRLNLPTERLDGKADAIGKDLTDLVKFVNNYNR